MRRVARFAAALLATALLLGGQALVARAAEDFISDPAPQAELKREPGWVTMAFDFQLDPSTAKMLVLSSSGTNVTTGRLVVEWTNVRVQLKDDLPKDTYTVHYRVSKPDGEPVGGTFQFAYGEGTWVSGGETTWTGSDQEPDVMKNPNPNPNPNPTTASAEPTPSPTASASVTPTPTPTPTLTPTPTPAAAPPDGDDSGLLLWVALVGVVAVAASAGGAWWYRSRRGTAD